MKFFSNADFISSSAYRPVSKRNPEINELLNELLMDSVSPSSLPLNCLQVEPVKLIITPEKEPAKKEELAKPKNTPYFNFGKNT